MGSNGERRSRATSDTTIFEFWAAIALGTLIAHLANYRGRMSLADAGRAVGTGFIAAVLVTLYDKWRERRGRRRS